MDNGTEREKRDYYYPPRNNGLLVIEELRGQTEDLCNSDQPLDLSQLSPNTQPTKMEKRHENEEIAPAEAVPRTPSQTYERVSPASHTSNVQRPVMPDVIRQSISPVLTPPVVQSLTPPLMQTPVQMAHSGDQEKTKVVRPFKAYLQNQLRLPHTGCFPNSVSLPNIPTFIPGVFSGLENEESFQQFRNDVLEKKRLCGRSITSILNAQTHRALSPRINLESLSKAGSSASTSASDDQQKSPNSSAESEQSNGAARPAGKKSAQVATTSNGRKRGRSTSNEVKDESYWERRQRNNEAAKRSRDARRAKEDEIAITVSLLEHENFKLRLELTSLGHGVRMGPNDIPVSRIPQCHNVD